MPSRKIAATDAVADAQRADEALAYVLLEEGRVVCERLSGRVASAGEIAALRAIHRDVGLAGYLASDRMAPSLRRSLVALVHDRGMVDGMSDRAAFEHLLLLCLHAADVLDRAVAAHGGPDLRSAHGLARDAVDALTRLIGPQRARELRREATRLPV